MDNPEKQVPLYWVHKTWDEDKKTKTNKNKKTKTKTSKKQTKNTHNTKHRKLKRRETAIRHEPSKNNWG